MSKDLFSQYPSNTPIGSGSNRILDIKPGTYTFRMVVPPKFFGKHTWRFFYSNIVDSTWNMGAFSRGALCGSQWEILSASVGVGESKDLFAAPLTDVTPVTYDGQATKRVEAGERFWSDPVTLEIPEEKYLVFSWCISFDYGAIVPYTPDCRSMCGIADGDHSAEAEQSAFRLSEDIPMPNLFGADIDVKRRIVFVGDSITQGIGPDYYSYRHWVAQVSEQIGEEFSVWNVGLGYARAQDFGRNSGWLAKAAHGDVICIMLGVNDLHQGIDPETILESLLASIRALRKNAPNAKIVWLSTPPFNYEGDMLLRWKALVGAEKMHASGNADAFFDTIPLWGKPAPEEHIAIYGGHPDEEGSTVLAKAFCEWAHRPEQKHIFFPEE